MERSLKALPLPDDPTLAAWASVLNEAGHWATVFDRQWRFAFVTDELRLTYGDRGEATIVPIGAHFFSTEAVRFREATGRQEATQEVPRLRFLDFGRYVLSGTPGGREALR